MHAAYVVEDHGGVPTVAKGVSHQQFYPWGALARRRRVVLGRCAACQAREWRREMVVRQECVEASFQHVGVVANQLVAAKILDKGPLLIPLLGKGLANLAQPREQSRLRRVVPCGE